MLATTRPKKFCVVLPVICWHTVVVWCGWVTVGGWPLRQGINLGHGVTCNIVLLGKWANPPPPCCNPSYTGGCERFPCSVGEQLHFRHTTTKIQKCAHFCIMFFHMRNTCGACSTAHTCKSTGLNSTESRHEAAN